MSKKHDLLYMREALVAARKGYGRTRTNPLVGAVVVKNDTIIARGYHANFGAAHAEVNVLKKAASRAQGATLYVTLEPCSTHGKTPPCTDAIIKAGIKRVVIADIDPNPIHRYKGIRILKKSGIEVTTGLMRKEAQVMNRFFYTIITKKRPFVILKLAQSLDGKIATATGDSKWITSKCSRRQVHKIRHSVDAILVGANTVRTDNPSLTVRTVKDPRQPARVILDTNATIPLSKNVFKNARHQTVIVGLRRDLAQSQRERYAKKGVHLIPVPVVKGKLDLGAVLQKLLSFDVGVVLVEGGSELAAALLKERLVDKVLFFVAPLIIGGKESLPSVSGRGAASVKKGLRLSDVEYSQCGKDLLVQGLPVYT